MRLFVDDEPNFPLSKSNLLPVEILTEVDRTLRKVGRAIVRILADGAEVTPSQLSGIMQLKESGTIAELRLESSSIAQMVDTSITEVRELLPELPLICYGLAQAFAENDRTEAFDQFHQLESIWNAIGDRRGLVLSALERDPASVECEGKTFAAHDTDVRVHLAAAAAAVGVGDIARIQDELQYELAPLAEAEEALFAVLAELNASR